MRKRKEREEIYLKKKKEERKLLKRSFFSFLSLWGKKLSVTTQQPKIVPEMKCCIEKNPENDRKDKF